MKASEKKSYSYCLRSLKLLTSLTINAIFGKGTRLCFMRFCVRGCEGFICYFCVEEGWECVCPGLLTWKQFSSNEPKQHCVIYDSMGTVCVCLRALLCPIQLQSKRELQRDQRFPDELMAFRSHIHSKRRVNETKVTLHQVGRLKFQEGEWMDEFNSVWSYKHLMILGEQLDEPWAQARSSPAHTLYLNLVHLMPVYLQHERHADTHHRRMEWGITHARAHAHSCRACVLLSLHAYAAFLRCEQLFFEEQNRWITWHVPACLTTYIKGNHIAGNYYLQPTPIRSTQTHKHWSFWCLTNFFPLYKKPWERKDPAL